MLLKMKKKKMVSVDGRKRAFAIAGGGICSLQNRRSSSSQLASVSFVL